MKKILYGIFAGMMMFVFSACSAGNAGQPMDLASKISPESETSSSSLETSSTDEGSSETGTTEKAANITRQISV